MTMSPLRLQLLVGSLLLLTSISIVRAQSVALSPILVEPYDGKEVVEQQIVWSWFMQSKAANGQDVFCDLTVVEILEGQTAEEAMRLNPPVILRENLTTSTWQTSPAVRGLLHGRRYAWQITAKVRREGTDRMQVVSRSELWELTYHDPTLSAIDAPLDAATIPPPTPLQSDSGAVVVNDTLLPSGAGIPGSVVENDQDEQSADVPRPVTVSGTVRHFFATENRRGTLSTTPVRFDRLQIDPTITVFGVPLNLSLLLTSEENLRNSDISRGAFGANDIGRGMNAILQQRIDEQLSVLEKQRDSAAVDSLRAFVTSDSAAIAERIAELETLRDSDSPDAETLQALNLLTPEQETIARFPSFGFGKVAPNFGALLFDRVTINGGAMEYNPGNFYLAAAIGKVQREVDPASLPPEAVNDTLLLADQQLGGLEFFRNVYSARIGYGRRNASYVAFTGLYADDDDQSHSLQDVVNRPVPRFIERVDTLGETIGIDTVMDANRVVGTQRNYGVGAVGRLQQKSLGLVLDGEFNLMYFDDDNARRQQLLIPLPQALPDFLKSDSALTDYNFAVRADWISPGEELGHVSIGWRYVGGGYRSVGLAGLRTDIMRGDARYRAAFLDRQIGVGINYALEEAGYKDSSNTSRLEAVGGTVDLRFRGLPAVTFSYQRHDQRLETAKLDPVLHQLTENGIEQASATVAYLHQWSSIRWSIFASAMMRDGYSQGGDANFSPDSVGVFRTRTAQIDSRISFGPTLTLGLFGGYTGTRNHPIREFADSTGELLTETITEATDLYNLDVSALLHPLAGLQMTVGAVTTYQRDIPQPVVLGGYVAARYESENIGAIELRFDYRESAAPDFSSTFPVERVGKVITTLRW